MADEEIKEEAAPEEEPKKEEKDVKDVVGEIAMDVWGGLAPTIPDIIKSIAGPTEVALQGQYKDATAEIFKKMEGDLVALKNKEIDRIEFEQITQKRKAAIYALYNANKISHQKPSVQKILGAVEEIVTTIIVKAVPALIIAAI
jgi:hypothetical protein